MNILIIEDDARKATGITEYIKSKGFDQERIQLATNMTDFHIKQKKYEFGLFIIDIRIPSTRGGVASQNGESILEIIEETQPDALTLAVSQYPEDFANLRGSFEKRGCILADYNDQKSWKSTLDHLLIQLNKQVRFDFLIFCALQEERDPYIIKFEDGTLTTRGTIEYFDIKIASYRGSIVLLPKMGLVNASVVAGMAIDRFNPKIVGMSGICGGLKSQVAVGQLVICEMVYEHQSGKWTTDQFKHEPYQMTTDAKTLAKLKTILQDDSLLQEIENGFTEKRPGKVVKPISAIFTSGSAVIANEQLLENFSAIHRKVAALDMEIYGVYVAASLANKPPKCIVAKTVVDLCDAQKDDSLHKYGAHISANFIIKAISEFIEE